MLRKIVWILPFLFFFLGYFIPLYFSRSTSFTVPSLINLPLEEALKKVSLLHCAVQVIKEKEESSLKPGTIVYQSPAPGNTVKPHQAVYVIISKSPDYQKMLSLQGKPESFVHEFCKKNNLSYKLYYMESIYPLKTCLGHNPQEGESLIDNRLIAYISAGQTSVRIMPTLCGKIYKEVKEFLEPYGIFLQVVDSTSCTDDAYIERQKPLAGSLIDIKKPITVYIKLKGT